MGRHGLVAGVTRHLCGWRPSKPDHRDLVARGLEAAAPPPKADLRPKCPPVRDQGPWGTCVANASLEAMGANYIREGRADPLLSRFDLYYETRVLEGVSPSEDSGLEIRDAMKVLANQGACLETTWPYVDENFAAAPSVVAQDEAAKHKIIFYLRLPSLRTIKASIAQGFPVVGGFPVPENMQSDECARTGMVHFPTPSEGFVGGHAVMFVGYDDAERLVTFQNSWSTSWGAAGFGFLPYRFFTDGLVADCWTIRREMI